GDRQATEVCASGGLYHAADPEDESFGRALCWFIAGPMPLAKTVSISSQPAWIMAGATPALAPGKVGRPPPAPPRRSAARRPPRAAARVLGRAGGPRGAATAARPRRADPPAAGRPGDGARAVVAAVATAALEPDHAELEVDLVVDDQDRRRLDGVEVGGALHR